MGNTIEPTIDKLYLFKYYYHYYYYYASELNIFKAVALKSIEYAVSNTNEQKVWKK